MDKFKVIFLRFWRLRSFTTWPSWTGFGVSTNWPNEDWENQVRKINNFFSTYLSEDWVTEGPCFAAGGAVVMYAWPKADPNVQKNFANQDMSASARVNRLLEQIAEVRGVKVFVGGEEKTNK